MIAKIIDRTGRIFTRKVRNIETFRVEFTATDRQYYLRGLIVYRDSIVKVIARVDGPDAMPQEWMLSS